MLELMEIKTRSLVEEVNLTSSGPGNWNSHQSGFAFSDKIIVCPKNRTVASMSRFNLFKQRAWLKKPHVSVAQISDIQETLVSAIQINPGSFSRFFRSIASPEVTI